VLKAAAVLRGDEQINLDSVNWDLGNWGDTSPAEPPSDLPSDQFANVMTRPKVVVTPQTQTYQTVGKPEKKVDAVKLVQGKPAFTADIDIRGMLYARVLRSPHAHARIKKIDTSKAKELEGVAAVLTWEDIPRVVYSTAGQSDPIPGPLDSFSLDHKVRFVGDRVAFVAAETPEIAEKALGLIDVEYEILEAILDSRQAMNPDAIASFNAITAGLPRTGNAVPSWTPADRQASIIAVASAVVVASGFSQSTCTRAFAETSV